ncbi:MAG TPA: hypothetical protein VGN26_00185 [Armatimonadota bacterium]|jgi:hypothetical protein
MVEGKSRMPAGMSEVAQLPDGTPTSQYVDRILQGGVLASSALLASYLDPLMAKLLASMAPVIGFSGSRISLWRSEMKARRVEREFRLVEEQCEQERLPFSPADQVAEAAADAFANCGDEPRLQMIRNMLLRHVADPRTVGSLISATEAAAAVTAMSDAEALVFALVAQEGGPDGAKLSEILGIPAHTANEATTSLARAAYISEVMGAGVTGRPLILGDKGRWLAGWVRRTCPPPEEGATEDDEATPAG